MPFAPGPRHTDNITENSSSSKIEKSLYDIYVGPTKFAQIMILG